MRKFRPSVTLAMKEAAAARRARGLPVYDFGLGETKGQLHPVIREAGERAFRDGFTMYVDPAGLPELREAVLRWLGLESEYSPDQVVVSTGAKQVLFNILLAVCNPADAVLLDCAPWVSYQPLATAAYAFPVMVLPRSGEACFLKVEPEDLLRNLRMRPHAKLFLLNSPCNPTAQLYGPDEILALQGICVEHRIYFVLDQLYWRLVYDGREYPRPRVDAEARRWLILVDGMSKNFRRTGGLRIGWCVAPADVAAAMANLQSHYTAGPASPTQRAALAALTQMPYPAEMVQEFQALRDLLLHEVASIPGIQAWPIPATFYSFWNIRGLLGRRTPQGKALVSSDDVAAYLAEQGGVITAPGSHFMQEGFLRVSFAVPHGELVEGLQVVRDLASRCFS
ncbi:MAG: aminotransferase class I/II-fold pyridoxal phosphate-dependent enzyme [Planctomycetes bacterium]|nr:aminotransferase class I/II-fold pyridoxal phosphate-dependent enzyme [Planctomycetota bacterium]